MVRPYLHLRATGLCLSKQIGEGLLRPENPTLSRDNARLFFGVRLALLVLQFLVFCPVMVSERAHNGLYEIVQLVIADARRTYQVPHLAT